MTFEAQLQAHEAERQRRVDRLSAAAVARIDSAFARFEHKARVARSAWGGPGWAATLPALFALEVEPTIVAVEASMAPALSELVELGKDQAVGEAEEAGAEETSMAVPVVGVVAGVVLLAGVRREFERVRSRATQAVAAQGRDVGHLALLADLRQAVKTHVELVATTEATRSLSTGALAAIRTYTGVDAIWRTEADPCPICAELAGELVDVGTGVPPAHPNCRCSTVPWPSAKPVPSGVASA